MFRPLSLTLALTLAAAMPAAAASFKLGKTDPGSIHNDYGSTGITIHDPTPVLNTSGALNVSAGAFDVTVVPGHGSHGVAGLANTFAAFCLDLDQWLSLPSKYEVTTSPFAGSTLSTAQTDAISALFNTGYDPLQLGSNAYSAGFQLALWEIVNEVLGTGESYDVTAGDFRTGNSDAGDAAARTAANTLLGGLGGAQSGKWRVVYLQSLDGWDDGIKRDSQNLVTVAAVPLPAAGAGLILALLALGGLQRRRRAAA
jgi:hypothetical protein